MNEKGKDRAKAHKTQDSFYVSVVTNTKPNQLAFNKLQSMER